MFTDPMPGFSYNGSAVSLPRTQGPDTKNGKTVTVYSSADGVHTLTITQQLTEKSRRRVETRYERQIQVTDPGATVSRTETITEYSVSDWPSYGPALADIQNQVAALQGWKTTANVAKLFAKEA